jgi:Rieske Fe-S protein
MGKLADQSHDGDPALHPLAATVPRRRVLILIGAGALAAGGGLGVLLEGCAGPPVPVQLDVDPATLAVGVPTEVSFTVKLGGAGVQGSTWLVRQDSGDIVAFDPRCTHALCAYSWSSDDDEFKCHCHDGSFALDGSVLHGPPPRPLDRFPLRLVGDVIEVDVPSGFATPRESVP